MEDEPDYTDTETEAETEAQQTPESQLKSVREVLKKRNEEIEGELGLVIGSGDQEALLLSQHSVPYDSKYLHFLVIGPDNYYLLTTTQPTLYTTLKYYGESRPPGENAGLKDGRLRFWQDTTFGETSELLGNPTYDRLWPATGDKEPHIIKGILEKNLMFYEKEKVESDRKKAQEEAAKVRIAETSKLIKDLFGS